MGDIYQNVFVTIFAASSSRLDQLFLHCRYRPGMITTLVHDDTGSPSIMARQKCGRGLHSDDGYRIGTKSEIALNPCSVWCLRLARLVWRIDTGASGCTDVMMVLVPSSTMTDCYERIGLIYHHLGLSDLVERLERDSDGVAYEQQLQSLASETSHADIHLESRILHPHFVETPSGQLAKNNSHHLSISNATAGTPRRLLRVFFFLRTYAAFWLQLFVLRFSMLFSTNAGLN